MNTPRDIPYVAQITQNLAFLGEKNTTILYMYRNITLTYSVFIILGIKFAIIIYLINRRGWEFCKCNHLMRVLAPVMKSILSTEADSVGGLGGLAGKYTSISNRTKTAQAASTTPEPSLHLWSTFSYYILSYYILHQN